MFFLPLCGAGMISYYFWNALASVTAEIEWIFKLVSDYAYEKQFQAEKRRNWE